MRLVKLDDVKLLQQSLDCVTARTAQQIFSALNFYLRISRKNRIIRAMTTMFHKKKDNGSINFLCVQG